VTTPQNTGHNSPAATKVFFYSHFFAPSVGGVETVVLSLARGLAELADSSGGPEFDLTFATQTPVDSFDDSTLPFPVLRAPRIGVLWRSIRSADIVHVAGPALSPIVLGLVARKLVVVEHHGFQVICPTGQLLIEPSQQPCRGHFMAGEHSHCLRCTPDANRIAALQRWSLTFVRRSLCCHVQSNVVPTEWLGGLLGLPNTMCIPHGIEISKGASLDLPRSQPPIILFQGRLVNTKGVPILLHALKELRLEKRDFRLIIIGDGPEKTLIESLAVSLGISECVRFVGRLSAVEIEQLAQDAAVVVVPSLGGEVFGLVVAEYMARGLPVISSDLGSFREVIGDAGFTFRLNDSDDLVHKLRQVLDHPNAAMDMRKRARRRIVELYDQKKMVEQHATLYRRLLSTSPTGCSRSAL
jgi:glycosyltransferase involved in cell wall biosynthesis